MEIDGEHTAPKVIRRRIAHLINTNMKVRIPLGLLEEAAMDYLHSSLTFHNSTIPERSGIKIVLIRMVFHYFYRQSCLRIETGVGKAILNIETSIRDGQTNIGYACVKCSNNRITGYVLPVKFRSSIHMLIILLRYKNINPRTINLPLDTRFQI